MENIIIKNQKNKKTKQIYSYGAGGIEYPSSITNNFHGSAK